MTGPDRFKIINNMTRNALVECGYAIESGGGAAARRQLVKKHNKSAR